VANPRVHATTKRVVNEAFAEERPSLRPLPLAPYRTVLKLERRISHEGTVSVGGNLYSVPDTARRRVLEVHCFVDEVRILEDGAIIASHTPLQGRGQASIDPGHRKTLPRTGRHTGEPPVVVRGAGDVVARRSLDFYDAVGRLMAVKGNA
jgi:hypothetical protein